MPGQVITHINQVSPQWLSTVLVQSGALTHGRVAIVEVIPGQAEWSTNARLYCRYAAGSRGPGGAPLPERFFLKLVNTDLGENSFDASEVNYYTRDYAGIDGVPLVRCYSAEYSPELKRYHILLDDLTGTHLIACEKSPSPGYGLALADGLAALHAPWWGAARYSKLGASRQPAAHIRRFFDICETGTANLYDNFSTALEPAWRDTIHEILAKHPAAVLKRAEEDSGFTLIHGDVGCYNVLVPRVGDLPLYIIDRQPFAWSLTTWLGAFDLAYAIVPDFDPDTRRSQELPILRRYHAGLAARGVTGYPWEQLYNDYRLCVGMCVSVAIEFFRTDLDSGWIQARLKKLRRALTAWNDLNGSELW